MVDPRPGHNCTAACPHFDISRLRALAARAAFDGYTSACSSVSEESTQDPKDEALANVTLATELLHAAKAIQIAAMAEAREAGVSVRKITDAIGAKAPMSVNQHIPEFREYSKAKAEGLPWSYTKFSGITVPTVKR